MSNDQPSTRSGNFFKIVKNLFWLFLFLQFLPIFFTNMKNSFHEMTFPKEKIGYLSLSGIICDSMFLSQRIRDFEEDESIKGILIKCNSGGGCSGSSQALYSELKRCKKPIVFFVENVCASGAYYIALAADEIIANPSSTIGSIGVTLRLPDVKGLMENWNVNVNFVNAGAYKSVGTPTEHLSAEHRAYLQNLVDDTYQQFAEDVANERSLKIEEKEKWADGKVFTGKQALELDLIDSLGSFSDAIDSIKSLAHIEGEIKLVIPKKPSPLIAALSGQDYEQFDGEEMGSSLGKLMSNVYSSFLNHQTSVNNRFINIS